MKKWTVELGISPLATLVESEGEGIFGRTDDLLTPRDTPVDLAERESRENHVNHVNHVNNVPSAARSPGGSRCCTRSCETNLADSNDGARDAI